MLSKFPVIAVCFIFVMMAGGCPEGGINTNTNDAGPPQRDSEVDTGVDAGACGDHVCDEEGGEDCVNCERDCLGIACSPVRDITVQQYRADHMGEVGETTVDLRTAAECVSARIPGATFCEDLSVWWDGSAITNTGYLGSIVPSVHNPVVFYGYGNDDATVMAVAEAAWAAGYDDLYRIVGGIEAWRTEGWFQDISYEGIVPQYYPPGANVYLIDTMPVEDFNNCHVQDATSLDTYDFFYEGQLIDNGQLLLDIAPDTQNAVLIFFCVNQACLASEEACEAAEMMGYQHIFHYKDGTEDWYCSPNSGPTVPTDCDAFLSCL